MVDRSKDVVLVSLVGLAVLGILLGSTMLTAYGADNGIGIGNLAGRGWLRGGGCFGAIEVSEEYKENATNVAKSDPDVQNLLNSGYSIAGVRPIISTKIDANGNVVMKATSAVVQLEKDTTSRASVWVDLEAGKVTRIEILAMTIIEKG